MGTLWDTAATYCCSAMPRKAMKAEGNCSVCSAPGEAAISLSQLVTQRVVRLLSLEKRTMERVREETGAIFSFEEHGCHCWRPGNEVENWFSALWLQTSDLVMSAGYGRQRKQAQLETNLSTARAFLPINLPLHPWYRWLVPSREFHDCRHEGGGAEDQNNLGHWSKAQILKSHSRPPEKDSLQEGSGYLYFNKLPQMMLI